MAHYLMTNNKYILLPFQFLNRNADIDLVFERSFLVLIIIVHDYDLASCGYMIKCALHQGLRLPNRDL